MVIIMGRKKIPKKTTVTDIRKWVLKDFKSKARKISNQTSKLRLGEYRIAMRVSRKTRKIKIFHWTLWKKTYFTDFHFWKQNPRNGEWWDKPGLKDVEKLGNVNPDNNRNWNTRYGKYNSKTLYIAFHGRFWSKAGLDIFIPYPH